MKASNSTQSPCPFCGALLPDGASFCPHCARSIRPRARRKAPRPLRKKFLYRASLLAAAAILSGGIWLSTRPQIVEGEGGVSYTDEDGSYQVIVAKSDGTMSPQRNCFTAPKRGRSTGFLCASHFTTVRPDRM